jgi:RecG-like helicase
MELKFSDLVQDSALLHKARQLVEQILASDPDGVGELTGKLVTAYSRFYGQGKNWSKIS